LQNGDYLVISKRLDGCDRIGPGCTGLFVFSLDGEEIGTLYSDDYVIAYASLSPNGHEIAFLDPPGYAGNSDSRLVVVDLTTLDQKDVITLQRASGNVVWSSNGLSILVTIDGNIELIDVGSSERSMILNCKSVWEDQKATDCDPLAWSPDNQWIAVNILSEYSGPQDARQGTYLMPASCINEPNACPSRVEKISDIISSGASWSPAGDSIAIGDYLGEIYLYYVESATLTHLADVKIKFPSLSWSPDGQVIAFAGSSQIGFIALQTGQISYFEAPNIGEYVFVLFWIHRDAAGE
jgi:Tol biopolymer transport system component